MGWLTDLGNQVGLGDMDRSKNEYAGVDRNNFNLPGFQRRDEAYGRQGQSFLDRNAPQSADSSFRQYQSDTLDRLRHLANGEDSMVAQQAKQAQAQSALQQARMVAGASPTNAGMAQRLAMQNNSRYNQGLAQQVGLQQIAERQAALSSMGNLSGAARAQDLQNNQFNANANLQQQGLNQSGWLGAQQLAQQNAEAQQRGGMEYEQNRTNRFGAMMNNPTTAERTAGALVGLGSALGDYFSGGGVSAAQSAISSPGYTPDAFGNPMQLQTGADATPYTPTAAPVGYTPGLYGQPMVLSDERAKTNVHRILPGELAKDASAQPVDTSVTARPEELSRARVNLELLRRDELSRERKKLKDSDELSRPQYHPYQGQALPTPKMVSDERQKTNLSKLAGHLTPYVYEYKNQALGAGPRVGVMAQDVEKGGPLGKGMVSESAGMKTIDMPKAVSSLMGLTGLLAERLDKLETKKKG